MNAPSGRFSSQLHNHLFGRLYKGKDGNRDYRPGKMHNKPYQQLSKGVYLLTENPEPCPNPYYELWAVEVVDFKKKMKTGKEHWEKIADVKGYDVRW